VHSAFKIDENLTWKRHIDEISKKVSAAISALKRIRSYISHDTAATEYQRLIHELMYAPRMAAFVSPPQIF
jgi:hypothetical protein